ncbi:S8 family peptidase [Lysobacter niastensis]|uniref:S8 family serine peptidase n=1 Tax=Lysobacter niastensis TaxID=380629 RepID=A0ABS0B282_9GAMM|nr:S8 family peptidase [Lysobacter niastensis]MBF6022580.1 S8 family serine peptidase [Lysobacter niastensis]
MKKTTRNLCAGTLGAAVLVSLFAYAADRTIGAAPATLATSAHAASKGVLAAGGQVAAATPQSNFDRFIVKYNAGTTRSSQTMVTSAVNAAAMRAGVAGLKAGSNGVATVLGVQHVRRMAVGADVVRLSRGLNQAEADALLAQLRSDPSVEFAQPDYLRQHTDFTPNDTRYADLQWHYHDASAGIRMPQAWDASTGGGVVVAVLDTGYLDHADLNANIVPGYDFIIDTEVSGDGDGRDADAHDPGDWLGSGESSFHGTHVAGTVAAMTNNALGVAGVAFNAKVQPVRVLGHGGGYTSDIADAITWSSGGHVDGVPDNANPAEVINMSLGGGSKCSDDPVTQAAIDGAVSRGVTVVVAAGNSNYDAAFFSPASCKGVITVGATGKTGARASYSNYGATVAVAAPGGDYNGIAPDYGAVWSLGNAGAQTPEASPAGDRLTGMMGTSMASPHVAGVVALMQSAAVAAGKPALTPAQVKTLLRTTSTAFPVTPPVSTPIGSGIVNAAAAVAAATQDIPADQGTLLDNRIALPNQTGGPGDAILYKIVVPAGKTSLNLRTYGGTGDVSLYTAFDRVPTTSSYDRKSAKAGNGETVLITRPAAGTYYLLVVGETGFSGVSVMAVY